MIFRQVTVLTALLGLIGSFGKSPMPPFVSGKFKNEELIASMI
jgi:hypothetical protein